MSSDLFLKELIVHLFISQVLKAYIHFIQESTHYQANLVRLLAFVKISPAQSQTISITFLNELSEPNLCYIVLVRTKFFWDTSRVSL